MYAFPADELMPLACKGRVRGLTPSRGEVDDVLGRYSHPPPAIPPLRSPLTAVDCTSFGHLWEIEAITGRSYHTHNLLKTLIIFRYMLTLIDSLDTLLIMNEIEQFEYAVQLVIGGLSFDTDVTVSLFEANIRVLG